MPRFTDLLSDLPADLTPAERADARSELFHRPVSDLSDRVGDIKDAGDKFAAINGRARRENRDLHPDERAEIDRLYDTVSTRAAGGKRSGSGYRPDDSSGDVSLAGHSEPLERALRTIETHNNRGTLRPEAADRVEQALRGPDAPLGVDAAYVAAVGTEAYERAFCKLLQHGPMAPLMMTPEETGAIQEASAAIETRGLVEGTGSAGGFALPIAIDPTITLSSNGALNPIRQLAKVRPMTTRELRGLTSDGIQAQYQAEGAEAVDNSPVLAQPILIAQRATAFVPFTFELDQDWVELQGELAKLIADAKDVLEATKFLSGAGAASNEPVGLLSIGTAGSLTTTQRVQTATVATFAAADVYSVKQALPPRFMPVAEWVVNPTTTDVIWQFVAAGSTTQARLMPDSRDAILAKPLSELSTMATGATTGTKLAIYGDFKTAYTIGDRLGMSLQILPQLFGPSQRPTGQRGAYAIWRNDARVVVPNALRYLEVK